MKNSYIGLGIVTVAAVALISLVPGRVRAQGGGKGQTAESRAAHSQDGPARPAIAGLPASGQEAGIGRRLSPAQLAELRQQVRDQWVPRRQEVARSNEPVPAERLMPSPVVNEQLMPVTPSLLRP